jgi:hypothetical protein
MVMLRNLLVTMACSSVVACAAPSNRYGTPELTDQERSEILPVVYDYISQHHMSQTIIDVARRTDGVIEISVQDPLEIYFLRKVNGSWRIVATEPGMAY